MNHYIGLIREKPDIIVGAAAATSDECINDLKAALDSKLSSRHFKGVFCEIGSGSGSHLIQLAMRSPESSFLGLELRYKRLFKTAEKAEAAGLENLLLARIDAKMLNQIFPESSLDGVYINFPDPWYRKRRWHAKRLLSADYLQMLSMLIKPGGFFSYKTDHKERFEETCENLKSSSAFELQCHTTDLMNSEFAAQNIATEFERLFLSKKQPIYYVKAVCSKPSEANS